ncbi:hypothetical protein [Aquisphaera giovannonii]|uniref:hypothetical protein n=1 Tax=Aquisphaera giovannonii TaxID=406548 RepID=UPI0011DF5563|nr:hypothetical protein [Aquisphaera giovannonii]
MATEESRRGGGLGEAGLIHGESLAIDRPRFDQVGWIRRAFVKKETKILDNWPMMVYYTKD